MTLASGNWQYALALLFAYFCVRALIDWYRDMKFYRSNGWDFEKSSGIIYRQAIGDDTPVPNKARVLIGAPLMIFVTAMASLIIVVVS